MARAAWRDKLTGSATPPSTNEFEVPKDPKALIAWLNTKREKGKARTPDTQMKLNLAYVLGQQWVAWDRDRKMFRRPQNRTDDPNAPVRVTANKIGGIQEHFIARLTKSSPEPQCRPVSDDDNDVCAAKAGTRILLHEMNRLEWDRMILDLYFWVVPLGFSYLHITWDPTAGKPAGSLEVEGETKNLNQGEIVVDLVPAFELAVDPNAKTMEQALWCVRTLTMTKEAVWEKYGELPTSAEGERSLVDDVYALLDANHDPQSQKLMDNVQVHQLWMKPCRAVPKGMVVTWCSSQILEPPKKFPFKHGNLPFVEWDLLPGIGLREGRTWVTDLVPLQADYNDARSREAATRRTLTPKLLHTRGSIDPRKVTSRIELIGFNPVGESPKWLIPDSGWLAQYESAMNRADMEMGDRAGQSDVSSGKPASASMPAAAILALQEADDTKMGVTTKLLASSVARTGRQILALVKQYWDEDRLVRTWSEAGSLEVAQFSGSDIGNEMDVHVDSESALPRSKSARVQLAMDLLAVGPPGTPMSPFADWRDVMRLMDVPGTDFMVESLNSSAKKANRENDDLLQGTQRKVEMWDNHTVEIAEHERARQGETYEMIAKAAEAGDPEATAIKAVVDSHIEVHYQLVLQQQGVPTPPGSAYNPDDPNTGPAPQGGAPAEQPYMDPLTGKPDPSQVATSDGGGRGIAKRAGIGGAGQPGAVPGISPDQQASSMGA